MKIEKSDQKPRTITEISGKDPQAFQQFIQEKDATLKMLDQQAKEKALLARQESLAWAS